MTPPIDDRDVDAELQFHLDARTAELIAQGVSPADAAERARREFGDVDAAKRYLARIDLRIETRRRRRHYMGELRQDLTYAFRRLRAAPAFTAMAVLTLALGIGANTAIFSLVLGVLLRPLPFPDASQLYAVYTANRTAGLNQAPVSAVDLDDWRAQRREIADLGGYFFAEGSTGIDLTGRGAPRRLAAVFVSAGFFETLGVSTSAGRLPREDEMVRGGRDRVVMLTHGFWQREFAGSSSVIGTSLTLNGSPYEVLGVLPETMQFPTATADVFVPFSTIPDSGIPRIRPVRVLAVVARAKPGVTEAQVRSEMLGITGRLAAQYPEDRAWDGATVVPLAEAISGPVRPALIVLFGAVGLVLVMACVNVAGLQLSRALGRSREIAVRLALGARRERLIRQLLTESLLLAICGGIAGIALARAGVAGLLALGQGDLPRAGEVTLDPVVIAFAAGMTIVTGMLFGILPALRISRANAAETLHEGGRSVAGVGHQRLRLGLVVAEVAVAMMLIVGAGLMSRSLIQLMKVDPGFTADHLLAVQFTIDPTRHSPPGGDAAVPAPWTLYYEQAIEKVRALPGVVSAAAVKDPPLRGNGERNGFRLPGQVIPAGEDGPSATVIHISAGYFATIGARVDGREFTNRDRAGSPLAVIVNQAFARQYFPGTTAVGKSLVLGRDARAEIVGVVNDIRQVAMATPAAPTMYLDNLQNSRIKTTIVARTIGDPRAMAKPIREAIWSLDPNQPITAEFTFEDAVGRALARPRLLAVILSAFGLLGLMLGTLAIYGIVAGLVNERRREIGVRLALGAARSQVLMMIVRRGAVLAVIGAAIGLAGATAFSRLLSQVLYGIEPTDPATLGVTAAVLIVTAVMASWLPARQAASLNPVETLRD